MPEFKPKLYDGRKHLPQQFKRGEVHNPKGRPKKEHAIPDILRSIGKLVGSPKATEFLQPHYPTVDLSNATVAQVMCYMCYLQAQKGDERAREFIADRTEGKVTAPIELTDSRVVVDVEGEEELPDEPVIGEEIGTDDEVVTPPNDD